MSTRDKTGFDCYQILGVTKKADTKEIKQAYRRLARMYHPDANSGKGDSTAKFQQINRAYEILRDPRMRMHYDIEGANGIGTSAASDDIMKQRRRTNTRRATTTPRPGTTTGGSGSSSGGGPAPDSFGSGFGDFSASSQRSRSTDYQAGDHTHVDFGDMSDPYYRGRGNGPRQAGTSMPSDQNKSFNRNNNFAHEVHVGRGDTQSSGTSTSASNTRSRSTSNNSQSTSRSTSAGTTSSSSKTEEPVRNKPFSDERFYGKSPDTSDSFFGGSPKGGIHRRTTVGDDIRVDWEIDLRKALFGGEELVRVPCKETCAKCEGLGAEPGTEVATCQSCDGEGSTSQVLRTPRGNINSKQKCTTCKGTGRRIESPCVSCSAQGMKKATKQVNVTIPAFMEDGNMIRLFGQGNPGPNGGPPGDLYVFLWAKDDPTFYRDGDKIYSEESIDFVDAVLGCTLKTPYFKFDLPPRTQHDHVVRLKGKGAPKKSNPKERGDHIVTVKIDMPKDLTKEEEDLFVKLKQLRDDKKDKEKKGKKDKKEKSK